MAVGLSGDGNSFDVMGGAGFRPRRLVAFVVRAALSLSHSKWQYPFALRVP